MCCPTGDTSLIWATFSQRNLWQLKMTTIVTNLWSPKIQNHRRYWVEISGPDNLVPDIASGQTKNHLLLPFSIFQRRGDRDRRIWNGRDPPCCIRRVLCIQEAIQRCDREKGHTAPYDLCNVYGSSTLRAVALFPNNHKAISFWPSPPQGSQATAAIYSLPRKVDF